MTSQPAKTTPTPPRQPARLPDDDAKERTVAPGEPLIRLVNVHKAFGPLKVLTGVSLELLAGQTTTVIGPSGTGKSVLLKLIVGLLKPDSGEVWYGKERVDQLDEQQIVQLRKKIGFLFQMGALFDSMNVRDNICFPLREHTKKSDAELNERCAKVLAMVGLPGLEEKMPADLSGGQRKRVGLARAIVLEPEFVLYDEPTTGLDPIRSDVINEVILALSRKFGITSLVVTHDMASASKISDRMVMLNEGKIIADAPAKKFPEIDNDVVRRFIKGQADQADLDAIHAGLEGNDKHPDDHGKASPQKPTQA
jgi:phospholipid/cholesterol/gamma-HCH transport system ATP-binding protein